MKTTLYWSVAFILMGVLTLILMCSPAHAAGVCGPHAKIVQQLETGYEEQRTGFGLGGNKSIVELFVSEKLNTWSLMITRPDGLTCLMATGSDWGNVQPKDEGEAM